MSAIERVLYLDAGAGAAGDMILGALLDLGVPLRAVREPLAGLPIHGWTLSARRRDVRGIRARKVRVGVRGSSTAGSRAARTWPNIRGIVRDGHLPRAVEQRALLVFRRLFEAEAAVHGKSPDRVHLHEAGAIDAIVDVVGSCIALDRLAPDRIVVSPLTTGYGTVKCSHGLYPVPAPATQALVIGVPTTSGDAEGERLTPTGAALLTTIADAFGPPPAMTPERIGYGAGDHDFPDRPNVLRAVFGTSPSIATATPAIEGDQGEVVVVECVVDDSTPQAIAWTVERVLEAGALDAFATPVVLKKGRLGHHVTVLARPGDRDGIVASVVRETTTLGVRWREERRLELERDHVAVRTRYGRVRVKRGFSNGDTIQAWPEYDDCVAAARRSGASLRDVQRAALVAYESSLESRRRRRR